MPVQGGNAINHGVAYAGMLADGEVSNGVSKVNKGTANIAYGLGVVSDGDDGAKLPVSTSTGIVAAIGLTFRSVRAPARIDHRGPPNSSRAANKVREPVCLWSRRG